MTTLIDAYDGILAAGASLAVVTPGGSPTTVPFQGILDYTPPARVFKKASYTPQSGTYSGKERVLLGSEQAATIEVTGVYEQQHQAAVDGVAGVNGCTVTLTLPDGMVIAGTGGVEKSAIDQGSDTKEITAKFTIALNAGWTYTPGAAAAETVNLSGGAATVDLSASPFSGTGKTVKAVTFRAPSTNSGPVTVAKGATNGYAGLGATFSVVVAAGEQITVAGSGVSAIGSGNKTLDLSGTGTDALAIAAVMN